MPASKRKSSGSNYRPLKRARALRRYESVTSKKLPLSLDHKLLRNSQKAVFRYHEDFTLNPSIGGSAANYAFRANSLYDPNSTGGGHQPRGFDQLMQLYQFFRVDEVQIEVWFHPDDGAPVVCSIALTGDSDGTGITRNKMFEDRTAVFAKAGGISAAGPGHMTMRAKPWEFMGINKDSPDYRGSASVNPNQTSFLQIRGAPIDTVDTGIIRCVARITYHATLTEPINPTSS